VSSFREPGTDARADVARRFLDCLAMQDFDKLGHSPVK